MPQERPRKLAVPRKVETVLAGAVSQSAGREAGEATVPTSSETSVGGIRMARWHEVEREKSLRNLEINNTRCNFLYLKETYNCGKSSDNQTSIDFRAYSMVVWGEEKLLTHLEGEWEHVGLQLAWNIEPCFVPKQESLTGKTHLGGNMDLTVHLFGHCIIFHCQCKLRCTSTCKFTRSANTCDFTMYLKLLYSFYSFRIYCCHP